MFSVVLEFLQDFLVESRELLQRAQRDILSLETDPGNEETLASIFRAFHTIKGGAGFVDANHLVSWAHDLEDLLDKLRSHQLPVTPARIDAILNGLDVLSAMFQTLAEEQEPGPGPADLSRTIKMLAGMEDECGSSLAAIASAIISAEGDRPRMVHPLPPRPPLLLNRDRYSPRGALLSPLQLHPSPPGVPRGLRPPCV